MSTFRILSIDGGGMRGIIPLQILKQLELLTSKPIYESFDLIAGTSTGGLLACGLSLVKDGKRVYSLDDLEKIYTEEGNIIFPRRIHRNIGSILYPQYSSKGINSILEKYFKDYRIYDCIKPLLITSYDIKNNSPFFFRSLEIDPTYRHYSPSKNYLLKDICRATSAAPTYFPAHYMHCFSNDINSMRYRGLIDGGVVINNPALLAVLDVLENQQCSVYKKSANITPDKIFVLSLGTGNYTAENEKTKNNGKRWGMIQWSRPIIDLMMSGSSQITDNHLEKFLNENYLRLNINIGKRYKKFTITKKAVLSKYKIEVNSQFLHNQLIQKQFSDFLKKAQMT